MVQYRYWDKNRNGLHTKFGDMVDLGDSNNDINLTDINHVQTSQLLYNHLIATKNHLNLKNENNVGICTDGASNVSSLNQGVAGKVNFVIH